MEFIYVFAWFAFFAFVVISICQGNKINKLEKDLLDTRISNDNLKRTKEGLKRSYEYIDLILAKLPENAKVYDCESEIFGRLEIDYTVNNNRYKLVTSISELEHERMREVYIKEYNA